jgi:hypothetical protein
MKRFRGWLFASPQGPRSAWKVIAWWEVRRLPFNLIVGVYGSLCFLIFFWAITASGQLQPGEDAVEPLALVAAVLGINFLFTLGWLIEVPARLLAQSPPPRLAPRLMKVCLALVLVFVSLPAAFWAGYRVLQLVGVVS